MASIEELQARMLALNQRKEKDKKTSKKSIYTQLSNILHVKTLRKHGDPQGIHSERSNGERESGKIHDLYNKGIHQGRRDKESNIIRALRSIWSRG